jgi:Peptidase family M28
MKTEARTQPYSSYPAVSAEAIASVLERFVSIGNRFVGTAGEVAARGFIYREFERVGLANVRTEPVFALGYEPIAASCSITGETPEEFSAVGLQSTAAAEVVAPAVYVGRPSGIDDLVSLENKGCDVQGKIVILHTYWPFAFAGHLVDRGAAALVVIGNNPDGEIPHYTAQLYPYAEAPRFDGRPMTIPGVTIEHDAGDRLLARLSATGGVVRVAHDARYAPVETGNIVGELPGSGAVDESIVIGAHYDTQLNGVGACDNGSGVAAVIAVADQWRKIGLRRSVTFAAFADEEHGFAGSVAFCRAHAAELDRIVAMVNFDAVAWAFPAKRAVHADPSFLPYVASQVREFGWVPDALVDASLMPESDHNAFIDAGIPACWLWRYPPQHPYYHSPGDSLALVDPDRVAETVNAGAYVAYQLAQADRVPIGRSQPTRRWMELQP